MRKLVRLFCWPHEILHVIALKLIGHEPVKEGPNYVVLPEGLTHMQYAFVDIFPVLVTSLLFGLGFLLRPWLAHNWLYVIVHGLTLAYTVGSARDIGCAIGELILEVTERVQARPK